jgi:cyclopropane-fatty-acyl-phospholipid synthase
MDSLMNLAGHAMSKPIIKSFAQSGISIITPDGKTYDLNRGKKNDVEPIVIKDWRFFWDLVSGYDLGFAEGYLNGTWDHDNLPKLFQHLSTQPSHGLANSIGVYAPAKIAARITQYIKSKNSLKRAKKNISDHYDLSNDFFQGFLDNSMTYSCAVFEDNQTSLHVAQQTKINRLINAANTRPGQSILDIGCGWGSLALNAATIHSLNVSAVTLSKNQFESFNERIKENDLQTVIDLKHKDYRVIEGKFDHIFSVEMLEAVGHNGVDTFFKKCSTLLDSGGSLQIQVIVVPDDRYDTYRKNCDYIQKYIFPGGLLLSQKILNDSANKHSFEIYRSEKIGHHYSKTLAIWREKLKSNWPKIEQLGFEERDFRKFFYYFSYCEGAFRSEHINTLQISYRKR